MDATRYWATNLRDVIDARGLRYEYVAKRAAIHPATLSHIMNGTRPVRPEQAEALAEAVQTPFSLLFELREREESSGERENEAVA